MNCPPHRKLAPPVILFADTFNRYLEPENLRAAVRVLRAAGYDVFAPCPLSQNDHYVADARFYRLASLTVPKLKHAVWLQHFCPSLKLAFQLLV